MRTVKITVLETNINEKLIREYGAPDIEYQCDEHKPGEVYYSKGGSMPQGLCPGAWGSFEKYIFALSFGAPQFWPNWTKPGIAITTCNDGLRPTVFKLEVVDDE